MLMFENLLMDGAQTLIICFGFLFASIVVAGVATRKIVK